MSDAYKSLPNLSGETAASQEQTRGADPSRFYPSPGSGGIDPLVARVLNVPRCRVRDTGTGSVWNTGGFTNTIFDKADIDTDHMWNGVGQIHFHTPGDYMVGATIYCAFSASAVIWQMEIRKNSVTPVSAAACSPSSNYEIMSCSTPYTFKAGDYVELAVFQNTGAGVNATVIAEYAPSMWAVFCGSQGGDAQ